MNQTVDEEWRKNAPPMTPEEEGMNPPHLQRLRYNPAYEPIKDEDIKIGDEIVIGTYASTRLGNPNIRWTEVKVEELPVYYWTTPLGIYKKKT